ncbi:MAG: cytochrome c oxidase assembly protein [Propionibacteriales bacterium]|nr:cytochrome c oxidase assembly protein [Propionibacteriales bacterium]
MSVADVESTPPPTYAGTVLPPFDSEQGVPLPELTAERLLTSWSFDPFPAVSLLAIAAFYLYGVWVLRRRGDHWPASRTFSFVVLGVGGGAVGTQSALATYDTELLSAHMVQHMVLSMVVPVFLALGAPVTLALRTLSRTPRSWLLAVLHSRLAAVLSFPAVAFVLFVVSPWALYFTGWYDATLRSTYLHEVLHLHFVVVGSLFFWPLLGIDPVPGRVAYPFRLLTVFLTLPFHAFLGVTVMSMTNLIAGDWYTSLGRDWTTPMADQELAGAILWGSGDVVGLVIFGVLFAQWARHSQREAEREDRRLDMEEARARQSARER